MPRFRTSTTTAFFVFSSYCRDKFLAGSVFTKVHVRAPSFGLIDYVDSGTLPTHNILTGQPGHTNKTWNHLQPIGQ